MRKTLWSLTNGTGWCTGRIVLFLPVPSTGEIFFGPLPAGVSLHRISSPENAPLRFWTDQVKLVRNGPPFPCILSHLSLDKRGKNSSRLLVICPWLFPWLLHCPPVIIDSPLWLFCLIDPGNVNCEWALNHRTSHFWIHSIKSYLGPIPNIRKLEQLEEHANRLWWQIPTRRKNRFCSHCKTWALFHLQ